MRALLLFLAFMLGLSLLLPWNCLLKSLPYIVTRVPSEWKASAPLWLTLTFTLTNCTTLLLMTLTDLDSKVIRRVCRGRCLSTDQVIGARLYTGLLGCAVLLGVACVGPITDYYFGGHGRESASSGGVFIMFWGIFVCTGWLMCLLQRSVYPLISLLPGRKDQMIPAMLTGQAIAGISASMGSFMFSSSNSEGVALMVMGYFMVCIAALLGTVILFRLYRNGSIEDDDSASDGIKSSEEQSTANSNHKDEAFSLKCLGETARLIKPWPQLLALNFAITISIFPGLLTSAAKSLSPPDRFVSRYFVSLTFLVFDVADLVGKVMPSLVGSFGMGPRGLAGRLFAPLRILFIPGLLLLPNFDLLSFRFTTGGDLAYFSVLALMAWTSGWGNAICLINAPLSLSGNQLTDGLGDRIGSLMGFSITFGLMSGSALSFILKKCLF